MGKAIAVVSVIVVLCFAFVLHQLSVRRPGGRDAAAAAPLLETRDDGSVYAVSIQFAKLERRLVEEEKRSMKLQTDLSAAQEENARLKGEIDELREDLRRLRRLVIERPAPPAAPEGDSSSPPPANGPASTVPAPDPGG